MKIKTIRVSYSETVSLPGYNNVKPGLTLEASVETGEDPDAVRQSLQTEVQNIVREQVNQALEEAGKRAKYHDGPTYQVMKSRHLKAVVVLPNTLDDWSGPLNGFTHPFDGDARMLRFEHAVRKAEEIAEKRDWEALDCSDGDLSSLEELVEHYEEQKEESEPEPEPQMPF